MGFFDLFAHGTRMEILQIPLPNAFSSDRLVWKETQSKVFTVKSTYQVALRLKNKSRIQNSGVRSDRILWKNIWSLNALPKVRMFIWRACSNILPTRANLHQRNVQIDPTCEVYCQHVESVAHILWECLFARNVWALCRGKIQKFSNDAQEFRFLFRCLFDELPRLELERWAVISLAIWNARNRFYFEKLQDHAKSILARAVGFLGNYQRLVAAQTSQ